MPLYDNPGQVNDEALNIVAGRTFPVVQLANSSGDVVDLGGGVSIGTAIRVPTTTSVASSTTSVLILAANADRRGLCVYNNSSSLLRLSFTTPAEASNAFVGVPAGSTLLLDAQLISTVAIYGIWVSENGAAQVTEWV